MEFYKKISESEMREGEKVSYVGVYVLKWGKADEPTDGFVEAGDDEIIKELEDRGVIIRIPPNRRGTGKYIKEVKADEPNNKTS